MVEYESVKFRVETKARLKKYMHKHELDSMDAALNFALDQAEHKNV